MQKRSNFIFPIHLVLRVDYMHTISHNAKA